MDEIAAMLEDETLQEDPKDVILFPPDDEDNTDEDSEDEDTMNPKNINHFGPGILSQQAEVDFFDNADELPDITEVK